MTPQFWEKHVFEKPESKFEDQVTYWEGTSMRYHLSKPQEVSTSQVEGSMTISQLIEVTQVD